MRSTQVSTCLHERKENVGTSLREKEYKTELFQKLTNCICYEQSKNLTKENLTLFILGRLFLLKLNSKKYISIKIAKNEVRKGVIHQWPPNKSHLMRNE